MKITLDKYGFISGYAIMGDMDNSIDIYEVIDIDNYFNYYYDKDSKKLLLVNDRKDRIIKYGKLNELKDGEYVDGGMLKYKKKPDKYIQYEWKNDEWLPCEDVYDVKKRIELQMVESLNDIKTRKELEIDCSEEEKELNELKTFYKGLVK